MGGIKKIKSFHLLNYSTGICSLVSCQDRSVWRGQHLKLFGMGLVQALCNKQVTSVLCIVTGIFPHKEKKGIYRSGVIFPTPLYYFSFVLLLIYSFLMQKIIQFLFSWLVMFNAFWHVMLVDEIGGEKLRDDLKCYFHDCATLEYGTKANMTHEPPEENNQDDRTLN